MDKLSVHERNRKGIGRKKVTSKSCTSTLQISDPHHDKTLLPWKHGRDRSKYFSNKFVSLQTFDKYHK